MALFRQILIVILFCLSAAGQDPMPPLDAALLKLTSALAPNSQRPPAAPAAPSPPPLIKAAGKEFIQAWQIYHTVRTPTSSVAAKPIPQPRTDPIVHHVEWQALNEFVERCINANPPPELSEFSRFTYASLDWCDWGAPHFLSSCEKAKALVLLRQNKHYEGMKELSGYPGPALDFLLRAFGIDTEEFGIGSWLAGTLSPEKLCETGGEKTARMLMDWIDLRFDAALKTQGRSTATNASPSESEPLFPKESLLQLLRPDRGVSEETKARIAAYIDTRGLKIVPVITWIQKCPPGAEKWLTRLATRSLTHEFNAVRQRSADMLDRAGVAHPKLILRPGPRFEVTLDGEPWPGRLQNPFLVESGLTLNLHSVSGGNFFAGIHYTPQGIYQGDPDAFRRPGPLDLVEYRTIPRLENDKPTPFNYLYLRARVRLPISYSEINRLEIQTTALTIRPVFPGTVPLAAEDVYEVEFDFATGAKNEKPPVHLRNVIRATGSEPLTLPNVSPGQYWIRICHPGAVLAPPEKITVSSRRHSYEPVLVCGACLVIPIDWPEMSEPTALPLDLKTIFSRTSQAMSYNLRSMLILRRVNGSVIEALGMAKHADGGNTNVLSPTPAAAGAKFPDAAIFPYLPPGEYLVESPARTIDPIDTSPGCVIRRSAVTITIGKDSPAFVVSEPLKILYTRKD